MASLLRNIAVCALSVCALGGFAQQDRNLIVHKTDGTIQTINLTDVDSLTFEKRQTGALSIDLDIHSTYAKEMLRCSDPTMRYYVSYLEKEYFDLYTSDEQLAEEDKTWFVEMAESSGMSVESFVESFTYTGDYDDYQTDLLPGREYVIWMHGVDNEGNCTTPITKVAFRTKEAKRTDATINLQAEKTDDSSVKVVCTPSDKNHYYTLGYVIKNNMKDEFTGDPLGLRDYMQKGLCAPIYDYLDGDNGSLERYLEEAGSKGDQTVTFSGLQEGVEYYIVAAYIDDEAALCSDIVQIEVAKDGTIGSPTMVKAPQKRIGNTVLRHFKK